MKTKVFLTIGVTATLLGANAAVIVQLYKDDCYFRSAVRTVCGAEDSAPACIRLLHGPLYDPR